MSPVKLKSDELFRADIDFNIGFVSKLQAVSNPHYHDFYELVIVTEGSFIHMINGSEQTISQGDFIFIRPKDVHCYRTDNNNESEFINYCFKKNVFTGLMQYLGHEFNFDRLLECKDPPKTILTKNEYHSVKAWIENLFSTVSGDIAYYNISLKYYLLHLITKHFPVHNSDNTATIPLWLEYLCNQMRKRENMIKGIAHMQVLAQKSPEHISRSFKKYLNTTPTEFINDIRLNYSKNILLNTDKDITDICYEAGFGSFSHFLHLFKKYYGMPPQNFRKLYKNNMFLQKNHP